MERIARIQAELAKAGIDGWLFFDFHNRDPISYRILGLEFGKFTSRRWFYLVPKSGPPVKLVSAVEAGKLDALPGEKRVYRSWRELLDHLRGMLDGLSTVAMQYSPRGDVPYVSIVDAGTVELVRAAGVEVVSSAPLVQVFEAVLTPEQLESHVKAGEKIHRIKDEAFALVSQKVRGGHVITAYDVQQFIVRRFEEEGLTCQGEYPIVGTNEQPADPHFEPTPENARPIKLGDTLLVDLWAKLKEPNAVFYDITWCAFVGENPPAKYSEIFRLACQARDAALALVQERFAQGQPLAGYEVDDAARQVIEKAGYGPYFVHRTGHNIGTEVHGNGANLDNLETRDNRLLVPGLCFSIEPGIYLPGEMAVRTEINVFITHDGKPQVYGPIQKELVLL
ncbi:lipoprotein [Thermoanaerobaculum aquaticum]|uniref:Lipoprotein n=1 Tax=Thermoanaerobaculum aquaticum TaxID=1312852 RepID=A0A062XW87_9BACT|nr:Xaa-Pro peptidase family protein [Thermoanaerobaculum aquaticum]KDA53674.1 lipoprotein [Thermoanaerobaculum aquaticum]